MLGSITSTPQAKGTVTSRQCAVFQISVLSMCASMSGWLIYEPATTYTRSNGKHSRVGVHVSI